jgi:hypothetical protein
MVPRTGANDWIVPAERAVAEKKPINWRNVLTVYGAAILVGTELVGLTWAGAWALGGLFDLPATVRYVIEAVGAGLGMYGVYHFVRAALKVEPIRG